MSDPRDDPPEVPPASGRSRGGKGGAEPRTVIHARERRVADLSAQGWTQEAIAADLGLYQAAVSKILRRIDERAVRALTERIVHLKMRRARHLEYLSREGRRGWEQSKTGRVRRRQRKAAGADGAPVVTQEVMVDEHPDPRMLDQARKAEEALVDMLGLGAPHDRSTPGAPAGGEPSRPVLVQLSTDTLERAYAELTATRTSPDEPE